MADAERVEWIGMDGMTEVQHICVACDGTRAGKAAARRELARFARTYGYRGRLSTREVGDYDMELQRTIVRIDAVFYGNAPKRAKGKSNG